MFDILLSLAYLFYKEGKERKKNEEIYSSMGLAEQSENERRRRRRVAKILRRRKNAIVTFK